MNSHDRVLRAVTFDTPDRVPIAKGPDADIALVGYRSPRDFRPQREGVNEWGCLWSSLNASQGDQGQVVEHPLAHWDRSEAYRFPDPLAPGRFEHAPAELASHRRAGRFVFGHLGKGPMHLLDDLRGFENYLSDLLLGPQRIDWMLDGIFGVLDALVQQFADLGIDGVFLADDQAMQTGPIFSMDLWRRHLKPRYRTLFDRAHARGLVVYMHACGDLSQHLVDLHEAGVDMIDNKQPSLWMDSPAVDAVRGKLAFSTCLDIQSTMQTIPLEQVEAQTHGLIRRLALARGGFVGTWYDQPDLHLDQRKVDLMRQAFLTVSWSG